MNCVTIAEADMYRRHEEVPVYEYRDAIIEAHYFNTVQTALRRLGAELSLSIPGLKTLDLILQPDAWIVVDRALYDVPIAAWTEFDTGRRETLHKPVHCQLRLYHVNAGMIIKRVLDSMEQILGERLDALSNGTHGVIGFPSKD